MARRLPQVRAVYLQSLAAGGDMIAKAILELAQDVSATLGALALGVIPVTGQLVDGAGNPVLKVADIQLDLNTVSAGTITVTTGTAKVGNGTEEVWLQTNASGQFVVNVANPTPGELSLLRIQSPDGVQALVELQF